MVVLTLTKRGRAPLKLSVMSDELLTLRVGDVFTYEHSERDYTASNGDYIVSARRLLITGSRCVAHLTCSECAPEQEVNA